MRNTLGCRTGSAMKCFLQLLRSSGLYLAVVVGGLTLFLVFAPLFGYLPYSDRPGPGWYGSFPAMSMQEFLGNAWQMLDFGLFFLIAFAPAALMSASLAYGFSRANWRPRTIRIVTTVTCAVVTAFFMFGAAWYISAGWPLLFLSIGLGALSGGSILPKTIPVAKCGSLTSA